jgi:hypothetical protein
MSSPPTLAMRNRRFHSNTNTSSRPGRVPTVLRQHWSIILLFGMAITLAYYTILTAPTVEQELIARRRRGMDRRYRQRGYGSSGSSDSGGGQQQERYQHTEVTRLPTTAMTASSEATTVAANWQSVDGRPVLLFSPLPPQMATSSIHRNGNTLTNSIAMDNATNSNSLASTTTTTLSLMEADDESTSRLRQGARTLTTTNTATSASASAQNNSNSSGHPMPPIYYYAALLSAVLGGALTAKRSLNQWIAWEADRQEDGLAYDIAYTSTASEIGYGLGYGSFVHSEWSGDSFDKFDL